MQPYLLRVATWRNPVDKVYWADSGLINMLTAGQISDASYEAYGMTLAPYGNYAHGDAGISTRHGGSGFTVATNAAYGVKSVFTGGGSNALFFDGHAAFHSYDDLYGPSATTGQYAQHWNPIGSSDKNQPISQ